MGWAREWDLVERLVRMGRERREERRKQEEELNAYVITMGMHTQ
jgi:hypothetical protein